MKQEVKDYYGKILKKSTDLKTDACCTKDAYPKYIKECIKNIHEEVVNSYFRFRMWFRNGCLYFISISWSRG